MAEGKREIDSDKKNEEKIELIEDQKEEVAEEKQEILKKEKLRNRIQIPKKWTSMIKKYDEQKTVKSVPGKTLYQIGRENSLSELPLEQIQVFTKIIERHLLKEISMG